MNRCKNDGKRVRTSLRKVILRAAASSRLIGVGEDDVTEDLWNLEINLVCDVARVVLLSRTVEDDLRWKRSREVESERSENDNLACRCCAAKGGVTTAGGDIDV